ncbi:MAG: peptidylprolyl isomerase [Ruminococcaceae bacterium]|nr:peptidylprolyl isomerase [Oscillospiraceae bacterium]
MKNIKILGIVTTIFLVLLISLFGILAAFGFFGSKRPESEKPAIEKDFETKKSEYLISENGTKAVIKTDLGEMEISVPESSAGKKFLELAKSGAFDGTEFKTLAENMFIQVSVPAENFSAEKTEFACLYGTLAFVLEEDFVSPSFFIVMNKSLSGFSKAYISEKTFPEEKSALYEEFGGIPEYEEKTIVFGKIISGFDTAEKIASAKKSGYTGGYSALSPVKIISVEISD